MVRRLDEPLLHLPAISTNSKKTVLESLDEAEESYIGPSDNLQKNSSVLDVHKFPRRLLDDGPSESPNGLKSKTGLSNGASKTASVVNRMQTLMSARANFASMAARPGNESIASPSGSPKVSVSSSLYANLNRIHQGSPHNSPLSNSNSVEQDGEEVENRGKPRFNNVSSYESSLKSVAERENNALIPVSRAPSVQHLPSIYQSPQTNQMGSLSYLQQQQQQQQQQLQQQQQQQLQQQQQQPQQQQQQQYYQQYYQEPQQQQDYLQQPQYINRQETILGNQDMYQQQLYQQQLQQQQLQQQQYVQQGYNMPQQNYGQPVQELPGQGISFGTRFQFSNQASSIGYQPAAPMNYGTVSPTPYQVESSANSSVLFPSIGQQNYRNRTRFAVSELPQVTHGTISPLPPRNARSLAATPDIPYDMGFPGQYPRSHSVQEYDPYVQPKMSQAPRAMPRQMQDSNGVLVTVLDSGLLADLLWVVATATANQQPSVVLDLVGQTVKGPVNQAIIEFAITELTIRNGSLQLPADTQVFVSKGRTTFASVAISGPGKSLGSPKSKDGEAAQHTGLIQVNGGASLLLISSSIKGGEGDGVASLMIDAGGRVEVESSTLGSAAAGSGVVVAGEGAVFVAHGSKLKETKRSVLSVMKGARAELYQCEVSGPTSYHCIAVGGTKSKLIAHDTLISMSDEACAFCFGGASMDMERVTITKSQKSGMAAADSGTSVAAKSCKFTKNGHAGIRLAGAAFADLEECVVEGNKVAPALVENPGTFLTARTCTIEGEAVCRLGATYTALE